MKQGYYKVKIERWNLTGFNTVVKEETAYYNGQLFQMNGFNYLKDELLSYEFIEPS